MKTQFQVIDWLKFLNIPFQLTGKDYEIKTVCFVCGKEKHFYINTKDHTWICFKCGSAGGEKMLKIVILNHVINQSDEKADDYFGKRGLSKETIIHERLGYYAPMNRYVIPYFDENGDPFNIAFRAVNEHEPVNKYLRLPHVPNRAFITGDKNATLVVITEGEIDALSAAQSIKDALVVGLPGASFINDALAASIPAGARIVAIMDDDQAGKTAAKKLRQRFPSIVLGVPGSGCKDTNDLLVQNGEMGIQKRIAELLGNGGDSEPTNQEGTVRGTARPLRSSAYLRLPDEHGTWLIEDLWVDRSLGFVAGIPKSMKSMLTLHLAYHVATGLPFCGKKVMHPGPVLLVQEEDNDLTIKSRLRAINGNQGTDNLWIWTFGATGSHVRLDSDDSVADLDEAIGEIQPVLVILDPLANMHMLENENDAASINRVLERLRYIRDLRKCSIMLVHHMRKEGNSQESRHWGQRMRGSSVLHAKSESALYVEKWGDMVRINIETKMAQGRVLELRYTKSGFVFSDEHGAGTGDASNA